MPRSDLDYYEAIYFFYGNEIGREMLYNEFESILDNFIPLPDLSGNRVRGAYVRVSPRLSVSRVVLFLISFDNEGMVDKKWNVPLRQLADNAGEGPDIHGEAIRLACRSQCSITWHQSQLWDPELKGKQNTFALLDQMVRDNRLGFEQVEEDIPVLVETPEPPVLDVKADRSSGELKKKLQEEYRKRIASDIKKMRLEIASEKSKSEELLLQLKRDHQNRIADYKELLDTQGQQIQDILSENHEIKAQLQQQLEKNTYLRDKYEEKLVAAERSEADSLEALREHYEMDLQERLKQESESFKEMLSMREVELHYRNEQLTSLRDEVARLRDERAKLVDVTGDHLLERMRQSKITFVAFHSGAGHLTIPSSEVPNYMEDPDAYVANYLGVGEAVYKEWLKHYQLPVCSFEVNGEPCAEVVGRVEHPADFIPGESDRCDLHQRQEIKRVLGES